MEAPVILLSLDTVRQDVFTADCFPRSWSILSSDFVRFPNALSHGVATPHAFPGIIAGYPVIGDGEFQSGSTTIPELFEDRTTSAYTNNGHLRADRGYDRGFTHFGDTKLPTNKSITQNSIIDRVKDLESVQQSELLKRFYNWYQSLTPDPPYEKGSTTAEEVTNWTLAELKRQNPGFLWSHYMDAHKPFIPERALDPPPIDIGKEELAYLNDYDREDDPPEEEDQTLLWKLYLASVRYLDRGLGHLLEELTEFEWYDKSLIILVSDHGELFGEHGHMWHPMTIDPVDELIDTPVAVKYPENELGGEIIEHNVQHSDILHTVAVHADKPELAPDGSFPLLCDEERITISKSNTSIRVTGPEGRVVRRRDGTRNETGEVTEQMREKLDAATFPEVTTMAGEIRGLEDQQRIEQLKALGYR